MAAPVSFAAAFAAPEHQPFLWPAGEPAALLIHGFPGTPAEMRPLAEALHQAGWTVRGLLLPGFGAEIDSLPERRHGEWVDAAVQAIAELQAQHSPTLVVGFSMGSAVAMAAAGRRPPSGLALMAPFWKMTGPVWAALPVMRHIFPVIQPFRVVKLDFSDPEVRKGIDNFMPGLDLSDPTVQQAVREFRMPIRIIEEIRALGKLAGAASPTLHLPTLVLQGRHDPIVRPHYTHELIRRLPGPARYREIAAAHDLLDSSKPVWPDIEQAIVRFAGTLT